MAALLARDTDATVQAMQSHFRQRPGKPPPEFAAAPVVGKPAGTETG